MNNQGLHPNSRKAYSEKDLTGDHLLIYSVYRQNDRLLTDRQVKQILGAEDMNEVRPRISELIEMKLLSQQGNTICPVTGKKVRICQLKYREVIKEPSGQLAMAI